jgi:excinuclease ABC subunit B
MPSADHSRKVSLVDHGFRLPSAFDHRPLGFDELQEKLKWIEADPKLKVNTQALAKSKCKTLFVSATPAKYELEHCDQIVEQIIRPT